MVCLGFTWNSNAFKSLLQPAASQGLLGVIKSTLEPENAVHPADQLSKLFSSQPFTAPVNQPSDLSVKTDSLGIDVDLEIGEPFQFYLFMNYFKLTK